MAASLAFTVIRGEYRRWTLTLTNDDGTPITGTLTNPRSEWRAGKTDQDQIIAVFGTPTACPIQGTISVAANVITIVLPENMTKQLVVGKYPFDVFVDLDGEPFRVAPGVATVGQNITVPE
jgi:hypothetical protein